MNIKVINFDANVREPVVAAFRHAVAGTSFKLSVLETSLEQAMEYRDFVGSLDSALLLAPRGEAFWQPESQEIRWTSV